MLAEVIAIGDELTTGQRLDTNSQWLSERLTELGLRVMFHTTVGDDLEANVAVFRAAIERADVVVSSGGLGPTADDLTREALAAARDVELVEDQAALAHIRQMFAQLGRAMPERNLVQALFPAGSRPIANPSGTAPGIHLVCPRPGRNDGHLFALPGVPGELRRMWAETVAPQIVGLQSAPRVIRHRRIKCFGAGESHIEQMLPDLIRRGREPLVGITASGATITLRVTASGADERACLAAIEPTVVQIRELLGALVYGDEDDELEDACVRLLVARGQSVATVEWATAGRIAHWLAEAASGTEVFRGGAVLQSRREVEAFLAGRDPDQSTPEALVEALAQIARTRAGADFGLAVGPLWQDPDDDAGQVDIALATPNHVRVKRYPVYGEPALRRFRTPKLALNDLRLALLRSDS